MKIKSISTGMYTDGGEREEQRLFALTKNGELYVLASKVVSSDPLANWPKKNYWKPVENIN